MAELSIRVATMPDAPAILALADRLPAFGPTTRGVAEIADRERAALADALSRPSPGSRLLVAEQPPHGVIGVVLLETRLEAGILPKPEAFAAMQKYNEELVKRAETKEVIAGFTIIQVKSLEGRSRSAR